MNDGFADFIKATRQPGPCYRCGKMIEFKDARHMHMDGMVVHVCADCYDPWLSQANLKAEQEDLRGAWA